MEENWSTFKSFILQVIHTYIPQKSAKHRKTYHGLPKILDEICVVESDYIFMPNKLTRQFIGMLIAKLGISSITNLAKLISNTKAAYLIAHLQEAEGNFGNISDPNVKKNVV